MREGIIVAPKLAVALLQSLVKKSGLKRWFRRPRHLLVGSIWGATPAEKKAFIEVAAASMGSVSIKTIPEPLAAAIGCHLAIDDPHGQILLDVGSGASEVIIIAQGKIIAGQSIRFGGQHMDNAIAAYLRQQGCHRISLNEARRIKESLGNNAAQLATPLISSQFLDLPRSKHLNVRDSELVSALELPLQAILTMVQNLLQEIKPELSVALIESGMVLTGGGALTYTLKERLESSTGLQVRIAPDPRAAVARGCQYALNYFDLVS